MPAVQLIQIKRNLGTPTDKIIVIFGVKRQAHLAACRTGRSSGNLHARTQIRHQIHRPTATTLPDNFQHPILQQSKGLLGGGCAWQFSNTGRHRFLHAQSANFTIEPQDNATVHRNPQVALGLIIQIKRRQAGIGGRFDPTFPACASYRRRDRAMGYLANRLQPRKAAKHQGHEKGNDR